MSRCIAKRSFRIRAPYGQTKIMVAVVGDEDPNSSGWNNLSCIHTSQLSGALEAGHNNYGCLCCVLPHAGPRAGCLVKMSWSRSSARERVNSHTSAAVPPSRYPNLDRQSLHRVLAMVTVLAWFLILSVDPARLRGIAPMKVFAAAPSTPTRRSPPSAVLVGRRMRVAEQGIRSKLHHGGGRYRAGRRRPVLTSCPATR